MLRGDSYQEVLSNRDFRVLWLGQALAHLGRAVIYVAVALYVYELTGSARELSFAVALELLPKVLIGPLAGLLADRLERKWMLLTAYLVQAGLVAVLPFAATLTQVYILVFMSSLLTPLAGIVRAAALPAVTGQELFVRGSSLDLVAFNAVNVVGPLVGGLLTSLIGARSTLFVSVGCLVGATLFTLRVDIPSPATRRRGETAGLAVVWNDLREGVRFVLGRPTLRYLLLADCVASLGWTAPDVAAVVYLSDALGLGGREYGLMRGTVFLSIALSVFVLGRYARRMPRQYLVAGGVVLAGLAYVLVSARPGLIALLGLWFVSGIGWGANWLTVETLWAEVTSDEIRGRAYSLADALISLVEVGTALLGGWLISVLGPVRALLVIGGTIGLGSVVVAISTGGHATIAGLRRGDARGN